MPASPTVLQDAAATRTAVLELFTWAEHIHFAYAWMSVDPTKNSPWARFPLAKVTQGVVGLQFAGTDVEVLEAFHEDLPDAVRVMYETDGTFHPKLLVGVRGRNARAIVGSSNFTRAAFSRNFEVNLLLKGRRDEAPIADLLAVVSDCFTSSRSRPIDAALIDAYRKAWKRRPKPPRLPKLTHKRRRSAGKVEALADLELDWSAYCQLLHDQDDREYRDVEGSVRVTPTPESDRAYLTELRYCQLAFEEDRSLVAMDKDRRQFVAGFGGSGGWFGSMGAAVLYKQIINERPKALSAALDKIPREGPVDDATFLRASKRALGLHGVGLGCWSRLVAMKRPDSFLSVNGGNSERIREVFGEVPKSAEAYLEFSRTIQAMPWASAPAPVNRAERELWAGRVALLDAVLYEPP